MSRLEQKSSSKRPNSSAQLGFSLMEVLIALAIASLASLALFQSMGMWVTIAGKASNAASGALTSNVKDFQFRTLVYGIVPGWDTDEDEQFSGTAVRFSAISANQLHLETPQLLPIVISLVRQDDELLLTYEATSTGWTLQRFAGGRGAFHYLGADGAWYDRWPPEKTPEPGPFLDSTFYDTPQLPLAIRLSVSTENTADQQITIAPIAFEKDAPVRDQDLFREFEGQP